MQEGYEDYYGEEGCCLNCPDSEEGCLCYNCKCTKCYWYTPPEEYGGEKGDCDKTDELKEQKKERWLDKFAAKQRKKRLKENNGQTQLGDQK